MTRSSSTGTCTGAAAPPALLIDDCLSDSDGCPRSWCRTARGRGKRAAGRAEEEVEAGGRAWGGAQGGRGRGVAGRAVTEEGPPPPRVPPGAGEEHQEGSRGDGRVRTA